ncbi:hypothetical protein Ciccas_013449, partial [Cichlidogyrus casuarinus]
ENNAERDGSNPGVEEQSNETDQTPRIEPKSTNNAETDDGNPDVEDQSKESVQTPRIEPKPTNDATVQPDVNKTRKRPREKEPKPKRRRLTPDAKQRLLSEFFH